MATLTEQINALVAERESNILTMLQQGLTYQRIAEHNHVAISTVCACAARHGIRRMPPKSNSKG
jgi:DNA-binding NarL/FixJ family response regulator